MGAISHFFSSEVALRGKVTRSVHSRSTSAPCSYEFQYLVPAPCSWFQYVPVPAPCSWSLFPAPAPGPCSLLLMVPCTYSQPWSLFPALLLLVPVPALCSSWFQYLLFAPAGSSLLPAPGPCSLLLLLLPVPCSCPAGSSLLFAPAGSSTCSLLLVRASGVSSIWTWISENGQISRFIDW